MLEKGKPLVLLDSNNTPMEVEDAQKFIDDIVDVYVQSTNRYLIKYQNFKNDKTVEGLLDL